jgi:hypothetical protein
MKGANMDTMPAKKKDSDRRDTHLGIRVTEKERKRLANVAKAYPGMPESALARIALMVGLDVIERDGIPAPKRR